MSQCCSAVSNLIKIIIELSEMQHADFMPILQKAGFWGVQTKEDNINKAAKVCQEASPSASSSLLVQAHQLLHF